ncbi:MAG TPA: nucleotidyltransferase domain-containing protein [Steroidobacteraceae bacterium]|nr:nucleotidyltransferase domain-containing protein [Steroidobacteraceae bacterium]
MSPQELAERLGRLLKRDARVLALFVEGSLARADADAYSDLDLLLVAQEEHHGLLADLCRGYLQQCAPLVYWRTVADRHVHGITADGLRCDFCLTTPAAARGRRREGIAVIWDRARIGETLGSALSPDTQHPARVSSIIDEFLRTLGLLPVVLGRAEYLAGVRHTERLRSLLLELLLEADGAGSRASALRLNACLSEASRQCLAALPVPSAERESIILAHRACAAAFLPRARALAHDAEVAWPEEFVAATARWWGELGLDWPE